jgi:hypothetical protein
VAVSLEGPEGPPGGLDSTKVFSIGLVLH